MLIDLSKQDLFNSNELDLATKVNYIYGKNGTGKSTLAQMISCQCRDSFDVRVFQGFEGIVGENHKLDAVVLGEKNTDVQTQIDRKLEEIRMRESAIAEMEKKISQEENPDKENLAVKLNLALRELDSVEKNMDKVHSESAKAIKTRTNPQISTTSYNKSNFLKDIPNAEALTDLERETLCETLKSEVKMVTAIEFPSFDVDQKLVGVNAILEKKVEPKRIVARIAKNAVKQQFAREGLRIHKRGDVCAFCGNPISDEVFEELGNFFSADETASLQEEIEFCIENLRETKTVIKGIHMEPDSFYPEYTDEVNDIKGKWLESVLRYSEIIDTFCSSLEEKKKRLFESMAPMRIDDKPYKIIDFQRAYGEICRKNNASDLVKAQKDAKEKLRLDAVSTELKKVNYTSLLLSQKRAEAKVEIIKEQIKVEKEKIDEIKQEIFGIKREISGLQALTVNEQRLADNINRTLSVFVGFELDHYEDYDNKGYYRIKDKRTGETRPIDQLSTGEKNVVAFLYFMEKLQEVKDLTVQKDRIIIFDDPLNSNDETMQYLIADKMKQLIYKLSKNGTTTEKVVILTHNISFYLNLCRFDDSGYQKNTVYHLEKTSEYMTNIRRINCKKEDSASAYEEDWKQLITLYNSDDVDAEIMLNTMRKIIETYTSFIKINKYTFCEEVPGAMELFNANSHGLTDFDASVNGFSKYEILKIFYKCFAVYESGKIHISRYWPGVEKIIQ